MTYAIDIDPGAQDAIAALPVDALLALAEAFAVLELTPWSAGRSVNPERNPDSGVRNLPFGDAGMITHLVVEHERRVDILLVHLGEAVIIFLNGYRYHLDRLVIVPAGRACGSAQPEHIEDVDPTLVLQGSGR